MNPEDLKRDDRIEIDSREEIRRRLDTTNGYDDLFALVKRVVEKETGKHRAGLTLILTDMPNAVGAYHPVGSNNIILNEALVRGLKRVARDVREANHFVFVVLMHEYLHSLGVLDELDVRRQCRRICISALGKDHPTVKLATANWMEAHPELAFSPQRFSNKFQIVNRFDTSSAPYLG